MRPRHIHLQNKLWNLQNDCADLLRLPDGVDGERVQHMCVFAHKVNK